VICFNLAVSELSGCLPSTVQPGRIRLGAAPGVGLRELGLGVGVPGCTCKGVAKGCHFTYISSAETTSCTVGSCSVRETEM